MRGPSPAFCPSVTFSQLKKSFMLFWGGTSLRQQLLTLHRPLQPSCTTLAQDILWHISVRSVSKIQHVWVLGLHRSLSAFEDAYLWRGVQLNSLFIADYKSFFHENCKSTDNQ